MKSVRICFYSPKGGAGKTTGICNLAGVFARRGWRVLIIDADPSFNASSTFPHKDPGVPYPTAMDYALKKGAFPNETLLLKTIVPAYDLEEYTKESQEKQKARSNIFIAPASSDTNLEEVASFDLALANKNFFSFYDRFFSPLYDKFNVIMIDAPGQRTGGIYKNAICMSQYVVSPAEFDLYSPGSLLDAEEIIKDANSYVQHSIHHLGYYSSKYHGVRAREQALLEKLKEQGQFKFLQAAIKDSSAIRNQQTQKELVTINYPNCPESMEFTILGKEILTAIQNIERT